MEGLNLPNYPVHMQACRVTNGTVSPPSVGLSSSAFSLVLYIAHTQQLHPTTLRPRDREPCFVVDLNNATLVPGYYLCRLSGSYNSLPVYEAVTPLHSACADVVVTEQEPRCEDGNLNIYTRSITFNTAAGCLTKTTGAWAFSHTAGNCGVSVVQVINVTNINNFTTFVENVVYFNIYDNKVYININNSWFIFCICGGGGSSSSSGGGSGTIATSCCPSRLLPVTLFGIATLKTGTCTCVPTNLTFTYDGVLDLWNSTLFSNSSCLDGPPDKGLQLQCVTGAWTCGNASVAVSNFVSLNCSPFQLVLDMTGSISCTGTFSLTIIE